MGKFKNKIIIIAVAVALVAAIVVAVTVVVPQISKKEESVPEIVTESSLEKIINVSELSTCTAVYNGIAKVDNPDKPDEVNYYVSYDAKVKAGFDFDKVNVEINDVPGNEGKNKNVSIVVPKVHITSINVDISSLDFMFINSSANTSSVTEEAYKACNDDAKNEAESQQAIYDLAKQNAQSVVTALVKPLLEQLNDEQQDIHYELTVTVED